LAVFGHTLGRLVTVPSGLGEAGQCCGEAQDGGEDGQGEEQESQ
jgi:hypothetical protein